MNPDEEHRGRTRQLRDEDVAEETLRFDEAGRTQELDADVAEAYVEAYESLEYESDVSTEDLDDVDELLVGTVDEVSDEIEAGEFDDRLDEVETRETEGSGRKTVFEAIEDRRTALEDLEDDDAEADAEAEADADDEDDTEPLEFGVGDEAPADTPESPGAEDREEPEGG